MGDRIDSKIEDHRRDPDPHPRLSAAISARLTELDERISAIDGAGDEDDSVSIGSAMPKPVSLDQSASPGTPNGKASAEDHRHELELPPEIERLASITGDGLVQLDGDDAQGTQDPMVTGTMTAGTLSATNQAGTGQRAVLAQDDGTQRAEAKITWVPGDPIALPWIGFWDMEGAATNPTGGAGNAFTSACPGYPGYALAPWETTTPLSGSQSARIPASGLYARYATWTPVAYDVFTVGGIFTDGVMEFGKANAGDPAHGDEPEFRISAFGAANGGVRICASTQVDISPVPELVGGAAHLTWVINKTALTVRLYVNGVFREQVTLNTPAFTPSTIGCYGSYFPGTQYDNVFVVNGLLSDTQIAELAAGVAWNAITLLDDGHARLELGADAAFRVIDHAGTGRRMVTADTEGDYAPVDKVHYEEGSSTTTGTVIGSATTGLPTSGSVGYFSAGASLVAGTYRLTYTGGAWNNIGLGSNWRTAVYIRSNGVDIIGYTVPGTPFASSAAAVTASAGAFVDFTHAGGPIGIFINDSPLADNTGTAVTCQLTQLTTTVPDKLTVGPAADLLVYDHAGSTVRMLAAALDGTHAPVAQITWSASKLNIVDSASATNVSVTLQNTDPSRGSHYYALNAASVGIQLASQGSAAAGSVFGQTRAGASELIAYSSPTKVLIGSATAGAWYFGISTNEEARMETTGWTFRQAVKETALAGTGQRMMTAAAADGAHAAVSSVVWTGTSLVIGTDPGGSEPFRVGGAARIAGALILAGALSGVTTITASGALTDTITDAATNTVVAPVIVGHNSSATPVAGFGSLIQLQAKSSTTNDQGVARLRGEWVDATHATRRARVSLWACDATNFREGLRVESDGSLAHVAVLNTLVIGTDPGGSENLRVGGSARISGAVFLLAGFNASHVASIGNAVTLSPTCTSLNGQAIFSQPIMSFAADSANRSRGAAFDFRTAAGSTFNLTNALAADNCVASFGFVHQGTGTINDFAGLTVNLANNSSGIVNTWRGIRINCSTPGSTVNYIGLDLQAITTVSGYNYGIQIGSVSGGTDARAITTGSGRVVFGDTTAATSTVAAAVVSFGGGAFAKELITGLGLWLVDGQTAPSATSGYAKVYVDTADGDLKIIFGDGTIKTIVTDT
jgi:hypothetical protein